MRKFLSLLMMAMFSVAIFAATETTVYYTASEATIGTKTVKLNINRQGDADNWQQYNMTLTELTYNGDPVYTYTYTDLYDGVGKMQFQLYDGDNWVSEKEAISSWTSVGEYNGKMYVHATEQWVAAPGAAAEAAIYDWAGEIGTTILGASGVEVSTVKIHANTDAVPAIKFGSSYVYADGKYLAIKPAKGSFKAGDVLSVAAVFNNNDDTKYAQVDVYAADGATRLFRSDAASTINGRTSAADPIVQQYTLASDQDSLLLGRYGNTGMFITLLSVARAAGETPEQPEQPEENVLPVVKLAGSLTSWEEPVLMANAEDSLSASVTLNLGIDHYQLKVVSDGNWLSRAGEDDLFTMHRDYPHVDHLNLINTGENIKLITDVAGEYTFTWTYADSTLVVTFPEAPAKPNYYLIGDSAFVVDAGATADKAWTPDAIASFNDTTILNLKAGVNYIMRLSLNGTWENHRDFRHLTDTAAGLIELPDEYQNRSIGFRLNEAGPVTIIYIPAAEEQPEVFKLIGDFYVYVPQFTDGYYLVGNQYNWTPAAERLFMANPETEGEFFLDSVVLAADDSLKVVYVENDQLLNWYPEGNNYVVDANRAGTKTIYFNPTYQKEWGGNIFIAENPAPKEYYAKYAEAWEWVKLTEAEGLWLTDTIVYKGIGININDKAADEDNLFYSNEEIEGALPIAGAEIKLNDTIRFSFNPADSVLTAVLVGAYVAPDPTASVRLEIMEWNETPFELAADKQSASLTIEDIHHGNYAFKMFINGEWRSNAGTISRENPTAIVAGNEEGNMTLKADVDGSYTFTWFFANDSLVALFPEKPVVPMTEIRLVPGVWNVDGAKFAAVTWNEGEVMEDGVVSDWFVGTDTVVGNIPAAADSIGFARFNGEAAAPSIEDQSIIWNHTDKLLIDKQTMIFTISGWPEEGKDYCPGYWGEYVEPVYVLENGYYLVGNFSGVDAWSVEDLSAEKKFAANPDNEAEYQLTVNMAENDQVKVAYVENDQIIYWYPKGDNYTVDHNHAGSTTMYFRPDYFDDWNAFGGYFYIVPTSTVDITNVDANAPAVKILRDGQLFIIKGEKMYNVMGQTIK